MEGSSIGTPLRHSPSNKRFIVLSKQIMVNKIISLCKKIQLGFPVIVKYDNNTTFVIIIYEDIETNTTTQPLIPPAQATLSNAQMSCFADINVHGTNVQKLLSKKILTIIFYSMSIRQYVKYLLIDPVIQINS